MFLSQKNSLVPNRNELALKVEQQEKQIAKYEKKLKDVIRAYKSLKIEKDALEESLQALVPTPASTDDAPIRSSELDETSTDPESEPGTSSNKPVEIQEEESLNNPNSKIETLQKALNTLTMEKARVEKALKGDKKLLLNELEEMKRVNKLEKDEEERGRTLLEQQVKELRATLRQSACERECEQSDHAAMIKEFQQKIAQERVLSEHLMKERNALKKDLEKKAEEPFEYNEKINELTAETAQLRSRLAEKTKQNDTNSFQLKKLTSELNEIKANEKSSQLSERSRMKEVESQLKHDKELNEQRVVSLELRISEISGMLGEHERQRQQDVAVIEKLKARCNQLDQENTALARASAHQDDNIYTKEDVEKMKEKLKKTARRLRSSELAPKLNLYELLELESPDGDSVHSQCELNYHRLQDEYEKYKLRAQAVLKSKQSMKDTGEESSDNEHHFKSVIATLQNRIQELQEEAGRSESRYNESSQRLKDMVSNTEKARERDVSAIKQESLRREADLEKEVQRMRTRTLEVLAEKEKELDALRAILSRVRGDDMHASHPPTDPKDPLASSSSPADGNDSEDGVGKTRETSRRSPLSIPSSPEGEPNVFYSQELVKKDVEIAQLRKELREKDGALRDLQHSAVTKELLHYETMETLKEQVRILEGKLKLYTEDANLEYLRNVTLQYMLCDKPEGKEHMLKAIGKSLRLSRSEIDQVRKHNHRWYWWNSTANPPSK